MTVLILKTDKRLGVKQGEIYKAKPYQFDPASKVTLLGKISPKTGMVSKKDPCCNQYRSDVKVL